MLVRTRLAGSHQDNKEGWVTYLRTSLFEGKAEDISSRILSMSSCDIKGYGAVDICSPKIGIISFRIPS